MRKILKVKVGELYGVEGLKPEKGWKDPFITYDTELTCPCGWSTEVSLRPETKIRRWGINYHAIEQCPNCNFFGTVKILATKGNSIHNTNSPKSVMLVDVDGFQLDGEVNFDFPWTCYCEDGSGNNSLSPPFFLNNGSYRFSLFTKYEDEEDEDCELRVVNVVGYWVDGEDDFEDDSEDDSDVDSNDDSDDDSTNDSDND